MIRMKLKGKVIVVTGASAGIGFATALLAGRQGASVVVSARREDRLADLAKQIHAAGGEALAVRADVSVEGDVQNLIDQTISRFGKIDVLVNNAGYGLYAEVDRTTPEQMERIWRTNFMGTFYGIRAAVPIMRKQGFGHIITISSVVGKRAVPLSGAYSSTKYAQVGLMESLRVELRNTPIRCTTVYPGATSTEFRTAMENPLLKPAGSSTGPVQTSEQVAARIIHAIHKPSVEVVTFRPARLLFIANAILPGFVDWLSARVKKKDLQSSSASPAVSGQPK
jgi:NAD(P)-dependent dehydrogenase (short-subunit alcohol dehydrogenase family)